MTIESATFISDLNTANPGSNDLKSEGDDHIRLVKSTLKTTFPNVTGAMTLTQAQLNALGTGGAPTFTAITTTTGNAILGNTTTSTLNVGNGGLIKDAAGNTLLGSASNPNNRNFKINGRSVASTPTWMSLTDTSMTANEVILGMDLFTSRSYLQSSAWPLTFTVNNADRFEITATGHLRPMVDNASTLGTSGLRSANVYSVLGTFSGAVTAASFSGALSGNISQFTNDAGYATSAGTVAAAGTLTGSSLAANVVNSSLTSIASNATDGTYELGFKGLPAASITTGSFVASDRGKCVYATAGVTIPNSTMAAGDVVTIVNNTASAITLTAGIGTLRQAGTANTGSRTLAGYGIASVVFVSSVIGIVSGVGLT